MAGSHPSVPAFRPSHDDVRLPTIRELVWPVFRYGRPAVATFLLVVIVAAIAAALAPRRYEAQMKILVKRERLDSPVTAGAQPAPAVAGEVSENELFSEVELLTSRDVLEEVVVASGLLTPVAANDASQEPREARLARAVRQLRGALDIEPVRKTTLIAVSYSSKDPRMAATVLEELATAYFAKHLAVHRPPGAREFFGTQVARLQADLLAAQGRLRDFDTREQVVSAGAERESTMLKLSEFEASLQQLNASVADTNRRMTAIAAELDSTPARHVTQVRDGGNLEVVRTLRGQILALEIKRTSMLQNYAPQYPPVVQLEMELQQLRTALAQAEGAPLRDETTDQNPTYLWLQNERARVRTERDALVARLAAVQRTVAEYRERAGRLDTQNMAQQDLLRAVKTAEDNLLMYQRKQEEARISDELDRTRITNVALAEPPSVPQTSRSSRRIILLAGPLAGVVLGLALAYALHALSPTFRTPDEVYRVLDVPVLASLPAAAD